MLNFDSNHKSINGSLKEKKKINVRNLVVAGVLISSLALFSGCAKNIDCNIDQLHAHNYVSSEKFDKYMVSEREYKKSWDRTDEYIIIDGETKELIDFENKEGLYRISHNKDEIKEIISEHCDYKEYRYKYTYMQAIPHTRKIGNSTSVYFTYIPQTGHSWTVDPNHSRLTGEERVVHYVYYGYKVVKDEKGKYIVIKSEMVDDINDLPEDFVYIKNKFYKKVYLDNKELEVDYEDGPEEDKQLNEEQQAEYEAQIDEIKGKGR